MSYVMWNILDTGKEIEDETSEMDVCCKTMIRLFSLLVSFDSCLPHR